jgi:adenylate kinase family enzyme
VILGAAGAGKTSLASEISERTGLPVVHLDRLFWRAGWTPAPRDEALGELEAAIAAPRWILDGNFLGEDPTMRFDRADTVVFLDIPRTRALWRVLSRLVRDRGRSRPDLPDGAGEGFDWPLLQWVWRYPKEDRPRVLALLGELRRRGVEVHHVRSRSDVRDLLASL